MATSEEFKHVKVVDLGSMILVRWQQRYWESVSAKTGIGVYTCTPSGRTEKGQPWAVELMASWVQSNSSDHTGSDLRFRHPYTEQTFLPVGLNTVSRQVKPCTSGLY